MKRRFARCVKTLEKLYGGEIAGAISVRDTMMARSRVLEVPRKNTGSVKDGNEVVLEK